jgi:hypothetical protein
MNEISKTGRGCPTAPWPTPLSYWRTFRAEEFDKEMVDHVKDCVSSISSTIPEWRSAVKGDAAAAIGIVLPCRPPERFGIKVDLPMTTLLNVAFGNPAAALVLSHKLRQMPMDRSYRARLATSWLVHSLWLGHRGRSPRPIRPIPPEGDET